MKWKRRWEERSVECSGSANGDGRRKVLLHLVRDTIRPTRFAEDAVVVLITFRRAAAVLAVTPTLR